MASDEERVLEHQLELQLHEQKDSLAALEDALASDSSNPELLAVHGELVQAIKEAEEGLFHLKRARLLREADSVLQGSDINAEDVRVEPLDPTDVEPEPLEDPSFIVGSKCRFRHTDGRWYDGQIFGLDGSNSAKVYFLTPTTENMLLYLSSFRSGGLLNITPEVKAEESSPLDIAFHPSAIVFPLVRVALMALDREAHPSTPMTLTALLSPMKILWRRDEIQKICKFFLQQRCRFGTNCRLSHGVDIPLTSLRRHVPTIWTESLVGSSIWAVSSRTGIWREAELESWDDALQVAQVVFKDDGSSDNLRPEDMTLSEHAQISDVEESESSSEESDSSDYEDDSLEGLGFLESSNQQRGIQKETNIFAKWENHTRGIASKMMANMGYREGMGLGASGQGMLNPIPVKVLPAKQSLDHALESHKENNGTNEARAKKRSRGGKRKREKKFAAAARAAKDEEESRPDVFNLINNHLAMHNEVLNGRSGKKQKDKGLGDGKKVDRRTLIAYDDEVKELRIRVEKLEEMVNRNKNEKVVYEAALRRLNETRKALAEAVAAHASASNAVTSREKEKRWLKF